MDENKKVLQEYDDLVEAGLTSDMFSTVIERIKVDLAKKLAESPDSAVEAHYEFKALQRIEGKINAIINEAIILIERSKSEI